MKTTIKEKKGMSSTGSIKNENGKQFLGKNNTLTEGIIRKKAFEMYLERGDNPGSDQDDWLRAEIKVKQAIHNISVKENAIKQI